MKRIVGLLFMSLVISGVWAQSTQLLQVAQSGTPAEVQALLDAGVDVNVVNAQGETALMLALRDNPQGAEIARVFIRARVDVNAVSGMGETALTLARQHQDSATVTLLVMAGARDITEAPEPDATHVVAAAATQGFVNVTASPWTQDYVTASPDKRYRLDGPLTPEDYISACKLVILERLKAPSAARFVDTTDQVARLGNGLYWYSITVDAQNSFGAYIRGNHSCIGYMQNSVLSIRID